MQIAYDVNGQFTRMTGIQHTVDSLLTALYAIDTPHQITAWAHGVWTPQILREASKDGKFAWLQSTRLRIDTAGNDFYTAQQPWAKSHPILMSIANKLDGRLIGPIKRRSSAWRVRRAARRYDVMHSPGGPEFDYPVPQIAKVNVATIYDLSTITEPWIHDGHGIQLWDRYYKFAQKHCARVITSSEHSKRDIVEHLGISADRVDVTPLAPRANTKRIKDLEDIRQTLDTLNLKDTPFVLYSGTLESRKNLPRLVSAFAEVVRDSRLSDYKLVLAGGNWNRHDLELRLHALEEGIGGRVVTTGYVTNHQMNVLMSSCQVFAFVSLYEGFGMPPLEAMMCGAPVVASNTSSLPEVVGNAGIQVSPTDISAIAGALHRLLTDDEENACRRRLSLERAEQFSWKRTAELTLQSYEAAAA